MRKILINDNYKQEVQEILTESIEEVKLAASGNEPGGEMFEYINSFSTKNPADLLGKVFLGGKIIKIINS